MADIKNKLIAIVGASDRPEKFGYKIFTDLAQNGYDVVGINPRTKEIEGRKTYKSLFDLPQKPDLVITVVPHEVTERVVEECQKLGIKEIWMQPGSESEIAKKNAKEKGINVTANACFMLQKGIW
jgi:uncharacterized protein